MCLLKFMPVRQAAAGFLGPDGRAWAKQRVREDEKNHFAACVLHKFHIRRPVTQRLALSPARPPPQPENHPPARCLPPDLIGFRNKNDRFPVTAPHVPPLGT